MRVLLHGSVHFACRLKVLTCVCVCVCVCVGVCVCEIPGAAAKAPSPGYTALASMRLYMLAVHACLSAGRMTPRPAQGRADGVLKQFQHTTSRDLAGLAGRHAPPQSLLVFRPSAAVRAGTPSDAKRRDSQAHPRHSPV
jgi:hypothetical protein